IQEEESDNDNGEDGSDNDDDGEEKSGINDSINSYDSDTNDNDDGATMDDTTSTSLDSRIRGNSQRFDRTKSFYLRTVDLGMTQDTIFPEQF
ncbi:hypothetical protein, partial [Escherichia coli]|uniref:hypothetical protein n=1 Tax=Escherichia coli TaxID=562 RepID=UPI003F80A5D4